MTGSTTGPGRPDDGTDGTAFRPGPVAHATALALTIADPVEKAQATRTLSAQWREDGFSPASAGSANGAQGDAGGLPLLPNPPLLPDEPGRLADRPPLLAPSKMPKRRATGVQGRIALIHALAHIELNAVNLALDMVARFSHAVGVRAFTDDWISIADDEARHFLMLDTRLAQLGARYGDLPAHDGLWEAARDTKEDILARLAVVPMVLEARGLDVCPAMINKLEAGGDTESAGLLKIIYKDEISHVRSGLRWFEAFCEARGLPLQETWQGLVRRHFRGTLKSPFNDAARSAAGLTADYYQPLSDGPAVAKGNGNR